MTAESDGRDGRVRRSGVHIGAVPSRAGNGTGTGAQGGGWALVYARGGGARLEDAVEGARGAPGVVT